MTIVFLHAGISIDGLSMDRGPLGGTETALIGVARALAKDPDTQVLVFTHTPVPSICDGVRYEPLSGLAAWAADHVADVLISIRLWLPFWLPVRSRYRVYFSPDAHDQPFLQRAIQVDFRVGARTVPVPFFPPARFLDRVDAIFCVGRWQASTFVEALGFPPSKLLVTGNAVIPERFVPLPLSGRSPACVYSSTPFRGLTYLPSYFEAVCRQVPQATLEVCSGMQVYGWATDADRDGFGAVYDRLRAAGATVHGSLRQAELAALMCRSRVYTYPNTFDETFCISVLEAQCAGLPVVTSRRAALVERVRHGATGFLIDGHPGEERYQRDFVAATVHLLTDDDAWRTMSAAAIRSAKVQTYDRLADDWRSHFVAALSGRPVSVGGPGPFDAFRFTTADSPKLVLNIEAEIERKYFETASREFGY